MAEFTSILVARLHMLMQAEGERRGDSRQRRHRQAAGRHHRAPPAERWPHARRRGGAVHHESRYGACAVLLL